FPGRPLRRGAVMGRGGGQGSPKLWLCKRFRGSERSTCRTSGSGRESRGAAAPASAAHIRSHGDIRAPSNEAPSQVAQRASQSWRAGMTPRNLDRAMSPSAWVTKRQILSTSRATLEESNRRHCAGPRGGGSLEQYREVRQSRYHHANDTWGRLVP